MRSSSKLVQLIGTVFLYLAMISASQAQPPAVHTLQTTLGVCKGQINVLSQQQSDEGLDMEVEVTIEDCDGSCQGSIEYLLLFADANGNEIQWQLNETWSWRSLEGPFTLKLHHDTLPGSQLKEVRNLKIGRCSCSV